MSLPLIRPAGRVRDFYEGGPSPDTLNVDYLDRSVAGDMHIGTVNTAGQTIYIGTSTTTIQIPGTVTLTDSSILQGYGDITLGDGDGDVITLGGGGDIVNLGALGGGDTITLNSDLVLKAGVSLDLNTNGGYLKLPTQAQATATDGSDGYLRLNVSGTPDVLQFLNLEGGAWVTISSNLGNTLDQSYDQGGPGAGRSITVDSGDLEFNLSAANSAVVSLASCTGSADGFHIVNGTDYLFVDRADTNKISWTLEVETFDLNVAGLATVDALGGFSIDGTGASNLTATTGGLTVSTAMSGTLLVDAVALLDVNAGANLDIDVTGTVDVLSTGTFSIDGTGASNVTATSGNLTVSTLTSGSLILDGVALVDINAGASLDVDVTGTVDILSTGAFSIDGTGASNVTATSGNLTLSTATAGTLIVTSAGLLDVDAAASIDIDTTGTFDVLATGAFSLDGTGASNVSATSGNLTLSTLTSGTLYLTSAGTLEFTDTYKAGSTYAGAFAFSAASAEWSTFKTNFGEVSLLNALNQCATSAVTLDEAYNASGGASAITVDAGDVSWNLTGAYSFNVDATNATGVADGFQVNNGTDFVRVLRSAADSLTFGTEVTTFDVNASGAITLDSLTTVALTGKTSSTITGGTDASAPLYLYSTSHGTKGRTEFDVGAFDGSGRLELNKTAAETEIPRLVAETMVGAGPGGANNPYLSLGFNRKSGAAVDAAKPSVVMNLESNYYDSGISKTVTEWYLSQTSPGKSEIRPFSMAWNNADVVDYCTGTIYLSNAKYFDFRNLTGDALAARVYATGLVEANRLYLGSYDADLCALRIAQSGAFIQIGTRGSGAMGYAEGRYYGLALGSNTYRDGADSYKYKAAGDGYGPRIELRFDTGEILFQLTNSRTTGQEYTYSTPVTIGATGATIFTSTIQATTAKLTNLTDGYVPYHISDASGLGNSGLFYSSAGYGFGIASFGTSAAGVLALASGTGPTAAYPTDAAGLYVADRGGTAGKAAIHVWAEDGTKHVFGDRVGINTLAPAAAFDVRSSLSFFGSTAGFSYFNDDTLNFRNDVDSDSEGFINYTGYNAGTTRFRNLVISDGKSARFVTFSAPLKNVGFNVTTFGTSSEKALVFGSGVGPTAAYPADAAGLYVADRGSTAGKAAIHLWAEDGVKHVFGDLSGIGTIAPDAHLTSAIPYAKTYDVAYVSAVTLARTNEATNWAGLLLQFKGAAAQADRYWHLQTIENGIAFAGILAMQANGGRVSIGTLAPAYTLDVNGTINAATALRAPTALLTNLTDGYLPYHVSDASGLGNSLVYQSGSTVSVNGYLSSGISVVTSSNTYGGYTITRENDAPSGDRRGIGVLFCDKSPGSNTYTGSICGYRNNSAASWIGSISILTANTGLPVTDINALSESVRFDANVVTHYYNTSNYAEFTVSSSGDLTIAPSGGDTSITGSLSVTTTLSCTTAKLSNLTDGYLPYHVSDASGLANSSIWYDGTFVTVNSATHPDYARMTVSYLSNKSIVDARTNKEIIGLAALAGTTDYTMSAPIVPENLRAGLLGVHSASGSFGTGVLGLSYGGWLGSFGGRFHAESMDTSSAYGVYTGAKSFTGGNGFGLYIEALTGTGTNWGIYQAGTENNYLAGALGVGVTPTAKLQVKGSGATSATNTAIFENSSGTDILVVRDDGVVQVHNYLGVGVASPAGYLDVTTGYTKTDTTERYIAHLGRTTDASNYAALQMFSKGGATQASRYWGFQTFESGVANAGTLSFQSYGGYVGIGTLTADRLLTLYNASGNLCEQVWESGTLAHGMTGVLPTNAFLSIRGAHASNGGAQIEGASGEASTSGLMLRGSIGVADPTDATPAVIIYGAKKNGTSLTTLGSDETVFQLQNQGSPMLTVLGSGRVGYTTQTPKAMVHFVGGETSAAYTTATIALGYSNSSNYSHFIHTRHEAATSVNNAIDFYTGDGTAAGVYPTNAVHAMTLTNGKAGIGTTTPSAKLDIEHSAGGKSVADVLEITNTYNAADMDGTGSSIAFMQSPFNFTTPIKAASISAITTYDWAGVVGDGTMNSALTFGTLYDGSFGEVWRMHRLGTSGCLTNAGTLDSAYIKLKAGGAGIAPIQLTSGTLRSSVTAGDFGEYLTDTMYCTPVNRQAISGVIFANYDHVNITGSTELTMAHATNVKLTKTLAANFFGTQAKMVRIKMAGWYENTTHDTITLVCRIGGVPSGHSLGSCSYTFLNNYAQQPWDGEFIISCFSTGASGVLCTWGKVNIWSAANTLLTTMTAIGEVEGHTVDLTASQALEMTAKWGTTGSDWHVTHYYHEVLA